MSVALLLSTVGAAPIAAAAAPAAPSPTSGAYAGTHVSFEATNDAITNYAVDGTVLVDDVQIESKSEAEQRGAFQAGADLSSTTEVSGSSMSAESQTETRASISTGSGADVEAHDSNRGHLVVDANEESQLVGVELSNDSEAEQESDDRVVVTNEDGTQGAFVVAGNGEVTVNDAGNVTAELGEGGKLVYRQYDDERDDDDREQENLIADGTAAAEVYVTSTAESGGETAADVVTYGEDTTVDVVMHGENELQVTAERTESEGRIIVMSLSDAVAEQSDDLSVTVDGEAATSVDSHSDLRAAADGGNSSAYMVQQDTSAESSADVLVAVNHFSERDIRATTTDETGSDDGNETDTTEESDETSSDDGSSQTEDDATESNQDSSNEEIPGFGVVATLSAIAALLIGRTQL